MHGSIFSRSNPAIFILPTRPPHPAPQSPQPKNKSVATPERKVVNSFFKEKTPFSKKTLSWEANGKHNGKKEINLKIFIRLSSLITLCIILKFTLALCPPCYTHTHTHTHKHTHTHTHTHIYIYILLRARRNEKDLKVKPATSFKYFQYLLTKN